MNMKLFGTLAFALVSVLSAGASAFAGELDRAAGAAPQGLVVRVDASGNREVFKASELGADVSDDAAAAEAVAKFVKDENLVERVAPASELDRASSSEAWYYWPGASYGYAYSYWYSGYSYNYYPCYSWNYSYYSYSYYRWY